MTGGNPRFSVYGEIYHNSELIARAIFDNLRLYLDYSNYLVTGGNFANNHPSLKNIENLTFRSQIFLLNLIAGNVPIPVNIAILLTKQEILKASGSSRSHFARDCKCLFEYNIVKKINKSFVVNPSLVFNGYVRWQNIAITHYNEGKKFDTEDFRLLCNKLREMKRLGELEDSDDFEDLEDPQIFG